MFDGGGFMSQANPGNGEGEEISEKKRLGQVLIPCTIKMIQECSVDSDQHYYTKDHRFGTQVKIVACIENIDNKDTRLIYTLCDGTGKMNATVWTDPNDDAFPTTSERRQNSVQGAYVTITAKIKEYGGTIALSAFDIRPVTDFNEITYHYLEVAHSHLKAKSTQRNQNTQLATTSHGIPSSNWNSSAISATVGGGAAPMDLDAVGSNGLSAKQDKVLQYYNVNGTSDEGCHIDTVVQAMSSVIDENTTRQIIDFS